MNAEIGSEDGGQGGVSCQLKSAGMSEDDVVEEAADSETIGSNGVTTPLAVKKQRMCADDRCINRACYVECNAGTCGEGCENQRIQRRQFALVAPVRTGDRGWGLQAMQDIGQDELVINCVGEVRLYKQKRGCSVAAVLKL